VLARDTGDRAERPGTLGQAMVRVADRMAGATPGEGSARPYGLTGTSPLVTINRRRAEDDEATAHLDGDPAEQAVQQSLATALVGRTSIVIAHRLSSVRDADRIVVIDDGRVVDDR
jgi:hypothetical protein